MAPRLDGEAPPPCRLTSSCGNRGGWRWRLGGAGGAARAAHAAADDHAPEREVDCGRSPTSAARGWSRRGAVDGPPIERGSRLASDADRLAASVPVSAGEWVGLGWRRRWATDRERARGGVPGAVDRGDGRRRRGTPRREREQVDAPVADGSALAERPADRHRRRVGVVGPDASRIAPGARRASCVRSRDGRRLTVDDLGVQVPGPVPRRDDRVPRAIGRELLRAESAGVAAVERRDRGAADRRAICEAPRGVAIEQVPGEDEQPPR